MSQIKFGDVIGEITEKDDRYAKGVYYFVRSALDYTISTLKKDSEENENRHVSGQELLEGIRKYALEQFGPMAHTVLSQWGIRSSSDFGNIVFNLIEVGVLGKNDKDDISDFDDGFDLEKALNDPFEPQVNVDRSRTA